MTTSTHFVRAGVLVGLAVITIGASGRAPAATTQGGEPATLTRADFERFKWIAGRWHGIGFGPLAAVGAFYEEYVVVDDSTIHMRTMTDSTFRVAEDSTRFEFRGGHLRAVPARGTTRFVTRLAGDSTHWDRGTTYVRLTNDRWRALFPPRGGGERPYYELRRAGR